jgi:hypothetical protein
MPIVSFKLLDLLNEIGISNTKRLLSDFFCSKDDDVEFFIRKKVSVKN